MAACELSRNTPAASSARFPRASAIRANNMTPSSIHFVPIVTDRLLKRSARNPPVIENRMNGRAKSAPTTSTSQSRSRTGRLMLTTR